jgi:hypothetical protein
MNKEEYNEKVTHIQNERDNKIAAVMKEFALSNNKYSDGDIFTDHLGSIRIEQIKVEGSIFNPKGNIPYCVYFGAELKRDGSPKTKGQQRWAYQFNDITTKK